MPAKMYKWDEWFAQDTFVIYVGEDYSISQSGMSGQVRNEAKKRGVYVKVVDHGIGLSVRVFPGRRNKFNGKGNVSHGMSFTPTYKAWAGFVARCTNDKLDTWEDYGGRGIRVCKRWRSFPNFFADMGERPAKGLSVDRIDNDGNYSCGKCPQCHKNGWPKNCRWATTSQQLKNRKRKIPKRNKA